MDARSPPAAVAARHGHVDLRPVGSNQLEQRTGRAVRQRRARAAREDRSHEATVTGEKLGRHERIDAVVNAMQAVGGDAAADSTRRDPEDDGLLGGEHAMLRHRQCHQPLFDNRVRGGK